MSKFAIKTKCKRADASNGYVVTDEGHEIWVCNEPEGWVEATGNSACFYNGVPADVKVFKSKDSAESFIEQWKGHPWYYSPNGEYTIVKIEEKYIKVADGFEEVKDE